MLKIIAFLFALAILSVYSKPIEIPEVSTQISDVNIRHPLTTSSAEPTPEIFEGRVDRIEFGWWKKVKHAVEKTVKKAVDTLIPAVVKDIIDNRPPLELLF